MSRSEGDVMDESTVPEVDTPAASTDDEVEELPTPAEGEDNGKPAKKAKPEPARGDLPEGYVTPVGLAKILSKRGLHKDRDGKTVDVPPQMVYSYIKNAPKDHPFPLVKVKDSIGKERDAVEIDKAIAWWEAKNARVQERRENVAAKEAAKLAAAEKRKAAAAEGADAGTVNEAEGETTEAAEPVAVEAE
jgi:hypothetical protein